MRNEISKGITEGQRSPDHNRSLELTLTRLAKDVSKGITTQFRVMDGPMKTHQRRTSPFRCTPSDSCRRRTLLRRYILQSSSHWLVILSSSPLHSNGLCSQPRKIPSYSYYSSSVDASQQRSKYLHHTVPIGFPQMNGDHLLRSSRNTCFRTIPEPVRMAMVFFTCSFPSWPSVNNNRKSLLLGKN